MLLMMQPTKKAGYFIWLVLLLVFTANQVNAQEEKDTTKKEVALRDRLFFGGNIGLSFGNVTYIEIAPLAGYRITPRWSAGIGLKYEFFKTSGYYTGNYSTSIYGGSIFTEYLILKDIISKGISIITHAEYEALSLDQQYFEDPALPYGRFILNSFLVGGGIRESMGRRSSINILALWNLNQTRLSPYTNPTIRLNFCF